MDIEDIMVLSAGRSPLVLPLGASGSNAGFSDPSSTVFRRLSFMGPIAPLDDSLKLNANDSKQMNGY